MQRRLFRLLLWCGIALGVGLLYACFVRVTGFGIPFRLLRMASIRVEWLVW